MKTIILSVLTAITLTTGLHQQSYSSTKKYIHTVAPAIEGWYFRAISGYPAAISFELVVLFKNGEYLEVGDEPVETIDVAASKKSRPKAWGTWKKTGATFYLTNSKNQTHDYKLGAGNWFPAFAYSASLPLKKGYEKATGGDYGNGTIALTINKINFIDATHFTTGSNSGISTPNAKAGKVTSAKGTYKISAHAITFTYDDGKTVTKSFAMGASGSPAKATNTMIFIGGDPFTDTE
ncbi:hypothetical protein LJ707_03480 [Mucilaginibacter sp. UR6-1]|uniref:hypothetical protein n=1 Tax=Mucilaginibacter sp. UR6-1 TaxID=1435643 RepID=UPI001E303A96|nr:hypothetical protein [Mucilaginibacter sp. UR6-1]MCC8407975.1 hypothetical protein [Mucilaginibacter sp. UR6-1]